jgi:hypothetical protein
LSPNLSIPPMTAVADNRPKPVAVDEILDGLI